VVLLCLAASVHGEHEHLNEIEDECMRVEDCVYVEEEECGVCHSMYMPECTMKMEYKFMPIMVEECRDTDCTDEGYRVKCSVEYFSECFTNMVVQDTMEDHPVCGVQEEEMCHGSDCKMMKVMKCKMEKKKTRKEIPETACETFPTKVCKKEKCQRKKCYERVMMSRETQPKEHCEFKEKRVCHKTENSTCRTVKRKKCKKIMKDKPCKV